MLCANCHEREGTETWVGEGGGFAYAHGMFTMWCKRCVLKAQLEHAIEVEATIGGLIAALEEEEAKP